MGNKAGTAIDIRFVRSFHFRKSPDIRYIITAMIIKLERRDAEIFTAMSAVESLNPNMAVLAKITSLLKDPTSCLSDIGQFIKAEPALSVEVLRISNTSFYSSSVKSRSIDDALSRIGFNEVLRIMCLILADEVCGRHLKNYGMSAESYWTEAVCSGFVMERLARLLRIDPAEAYTAGIVHSVGKVVLDRILRKHRIHVPDELEAPTMSWEEEVTGFDYAKASALMLERWGFPLDMVHVVEFQRIPDAVTANPRLHACMNFTLHLLQQAGSGLERIDNVALSDHPFFELRHTSLDSLHVLLAAARQDLMEISEAILFRDCA